MRTGRPMTRDIDFELLKLMVKKGFTLEETSQYFNCPYQTIQYYVRHKKLGTFKRYPKGKNDADIIRALEDEGKNQIQASISLGLKQNNISKRYKTIKRYRQLKEERFRWLQKWDTVKDVAKN